MKLPAGQQLGGFQIVQQIGRGAMGTVYRARQVALERDVALKVLDDVGEPEAFARFRDEAIRVARLAHPNILPVFDFGREEDVAYIAMALADGGTLAAQIGGPMPPDQALRLLIPAAKALDFAHDAKIVHRDVKPANLLFDAHGRLFLADFGLALLRDATSATWGQMLGTPSYMAPEQFRSKAEPASDIYALAVTLFQLLTGRVPFERENPLAVALAHLKDPIPSARKLNPHVSEGVDRALRRGMAKDPADRYSRAIELLAAVRDGLQRAAVSPGVSLPARPLAPAQAARPAVPARPGIPARPVPAPAVRPATSTATGAPVNAGLADLNVVKQAPTPGRLIFESKLTPEWARGNIIVKNGRVGMKDDAIEVSLTPSGAAQLPMMSVGVLQETWGEVQFTVVQDSGLIDFMFHEAVLAQSHCVRVDPQQDRVSIGLLPASGSGDENWLGTRRVRLDPGSQHTLLVVACKETIEVYVDGAGVINAKDATLTHGMARLRFMPAPNTPTANFLLRRVAIYRPPE